jgi:propanol-preferring alcohol dehydrogenase
MRTAGLGEGLHGGHADYILIPEKDCLPLPDDLSYSVGSVIPDGAGVPFHLLKRMGGVGGLDRVAVFGAGPIGLGMVAMLKHMAAAMIIVSEPSAYRRDLAGRLGATHVVDPTADDPVAVVRDLTGGMGVDKAIDCASHVDATTNQAIASVRKGGTVGLVGQKDAVHLTAYTDRVIHNELNLVSSCGYNLGEYEALVQAVHDGLRLPELITHEFPLEEIQAAFQIFDSGESGKVVIARD